MRGGGDSLADNKKYYYLKLKDNFFDSDAMIVLESMPDGYLYSNILLKLYLRSLKFSGKLMFNNRIPYNATILSKVTRHSVGVIEKALKVFNELGLIEVMDNGAIYMLDIQNFIGTSNTEADRKREYRKKIEEEKGQMSGQMSRKCPPEIEIEKEIELDKELDIDKDKERDIKKPQRHKYGEYKNVLLTDIQLEKLKNEFPNDWETRIERVSEYCESTGKSYKNYLATIRAWARKEKPKKKINTAKPKTYDDNPFSNPELMDKMMAEWKEEQRRAGTLDE